MDKCSGLPLALKVVGSAMSNNKTTEEWEHILTSLHKLDIETAIPDMEESLFSTLKSSYDNLKDFALQKCFLCCAQWPEDDRIPASDLIEYWIGFGLIDAFENFGEAFNKGHSLIAILNKASLLELGFESDSNEYYVKLHDVIRDMALWIVSECGKKKNKWIVCGGDDDLRQFSKWEACNWKETELISFKGTFFNESILKLLCDPNIDEKCQVSVAATSPRYPNLQSLFLDECSVSNYMSWKQPINFFPHMRSLIHLNLSGTPITDLPKEIQVLVNLRYLNISHTDIISLPQELKELKELKYFIFRRICIVGGGAQGVDGLSTISAMPKLQVLDLYGNMSLEASDLRLLMDRNRIKAISMLVDSVEILGLLKYLLTWNIILDSIENISILQLCDLSYKHGEGLMELRIYQCAFEGLLINGNGVSLKHISLQNLDMLKQITWLAETLPSECFPRLTSVDIQFCDSLRSLSWVLHLPCLRKLSVLRCSAMKELIDPADQMQQASSGLPTFPSLQHLKIWLVPDLVSLSTCPLDFPVLSTLDLYDCPKMKKLPLKSSIVNNKFDVVKVGKELWESLEWEDTTIRSHLTKFLNA